MPRKGGRAWRAATDALGILTRSLVITGTMATGTISAGPAFTAVATMVAALVHAGREHPSGRSGTAANQRIAQRIFLIGLTVMFAAAAADAIHGCKRAMTVCAMVAGAWSGIAKH